MRIGQTPKEKRECGHAAKHETRALHKEARAHCREIGDHVSKNLFDELLADEEGHIAYLETQLDLHEPIGAENYAQLNA